MQQPQKKHSDLRGILHQVKMRSLCVFLVLMLCACRSILSVHVKVSMFYTIHQFCVHVPFNLFISTC